MKNFLTVVVAMCALGAAGPLAAQTDPNAGTATTQPPTPIIFGVVTDMTSHNVTVKTIDGETMMFETDSRTVMPQDMSIGRRVKIEFNLTEGGEHHAGRVTPLAPGSAEWQRLDQVQSSSTSSGTTEENRYNASTTTTDQSATNNTSTNAAETGRNNDELPRTASPQPWLLMLGSGALLLGAGLSLVRRRSSE